MESLFPILAFLFAYVSARKSVGMGLAAAIAVGYFHGIVRANFLGVFSTFMFDAGMLGFYLGAWPHLKRSFDRLPPNLANWVWVLVAFPVVLCFVPVNDILVQFVALRGTVWLLPAILFAACLDEAERDTIARSLAVLNLVALAVAAYLYVYGVPALYPENAVTEIMYKSTDVAGGNYRIPATFLNAHAYGGTMVATLPLILGALPRVHLGRQAVLSRLLLLAGSAAACVGVVMCGARQPGVALLLCVLITWTLTGFSIRAGFAILAVLVFIGALVVTNERFQRLLTLQDTDRVADRVRGSANEGFFKLMQDYPMGAGMGSAVGTSLPGFLASRAPKPVGMENEYCRIMIDQGIPGLALWILFIVWCLKKPPLGRAGAGAGDPWDFGGRMSYGFVFVCWGTAFIGTGLLSSVPMSLLLVVQMGVVTGARTRAGPARAVGYQAPADERLPGHGPPMVALRGRW